jgi:hypothetical protein
LQTLLLLQAIKLLIIFPMIKYLTGILIFANAKKCAFANSSNILPYQFSPE